MDSAEQQQYITEMIKLCERHGLLMPEAERHMETIMRNIYNHGVMDGAKQQIIKSTQEALDKVQNVSSRFFVGGYSSEEEPDKESDDEPGNESVEEPYNDSDVIGEPSTLTVSEIQKKYPVENEEQVVDSSMDGNQIHTYAHLFQQLFEFGYEYGRMLALSEAKNKTNYCPFTKYTAINTILTCNTFLDEYHIIFYATSYGYLQIVSKKTQEEWWDPIKNWVDNKLLSTVISVTQANVKEISTKNKFNWLELTNELMQSLS